MKGITIYLCVRDLARCPILEPKPVGIRDESREEGGRKERGGKKEGKKRREGGREGGESAEGGKAQEA